MYVLTIQYKQLRQTIDLGRHRLLFYTYSGWTRGVQVKLWDPLRTHAIPERLGGVFTTRRYTNPRLPYLTLFKTAAQKLFCWLRKMLSVLLELLVLSMDIS